MKKEKRNISRSPQLAYNKLIEARGKEKKKEKLYNDYNNFMQRSHLGVENAQHGVELFAKKREFF